MKTNNEHNEEWRPFVGAMQVSESKPWIFSLVRQLFGLFRAKRDRKRRLEISAAPVDVPEIWSRHRAGMPRLLSVLTHLTILFVVLIPKPPSIKPLPKGIVNVALYAPRLTLPVADKSGGGGGGKHQNDPASLGKLPKASDKQLAPPDPDLPKNLDPTLIVEPTVVALELPALSQLSLLTFGDPYGIPGPPSGGSGSGNGIGNGDGHGIGEERGPGVGPVERGGGGFPFHIGGGITAPILLSQILPEYSEEARKARFQGNVVLDTIVREDGSVQVVRILQGIGFGLDQNAIAAVLQWKFRPARMNGKPVPVALNVEVRFNLR